MNFVLRIGTFLAALLLAMGVALAAQTCPAGYPLTTPSSDFADAGGGTVRHLPTGLIWKRCAEGQDWNGSTCTGSAAGYTWQQAFQRADAVNAGAVGTWNAGQTDWRVPNVNELKSIVELGCYGPAINTVQFPATPASYFWSGSPAAGSSVGAAFVGFGYGDGGWSFRSTAYRVRLVRAGQYFYNFDASQSGAQTGTAITAWEFYNTNLNHYFLTAGAGEAQAIDSGSAGAGWVRTGLTFDVYALGGNTGVPVCRFYGTPGRGPNSHFYTADAGECEQVKADPGWTYEGLVFNTVRPNSGNCPSGLLPVYRAYNGRWAQNDSNHRYTANSTAYDQTVGSGWSAEGAVMCTPNAAGTPTLDTAAATIRSDDPNPTEIITGTGARVRIPAGALPRNPDGSARTVVVTLTKDPTSDPNPLPGHTRGSDLYALTPDGERLQSNLSVTLPMRPGGSRNGLTMMRFNSDHTVDDLGGQYDSAADAMTATSDRFAKFAVGVRSANPLNGSCGSANGTAVSSAPTSNLCAAGTPTSVTGSGPWYWSCLGSNGGSNASCTASVQQTGVGTVKASGTWGVTVRLPLCNYVETGTFVVVYANNDYSASYYGDSELHPDCSVTGPWSCSRVGFPSTTDYLTPEKFRAGLEKMFGSCGGASVTSVTFNSADAVTFVGQALGTQYSGELLRR